MNRFWSPSSVATILLTVIVAIKPDWAQAPDNTLSPAEKNSGWILLFDIGLQDHGSPCWYKNIKIKPLKR